jgi:hypothetical protein
MKTLKVIGKALWNASVHMCVIFWFAYAATWGMMVAANHAGVNVAIAWYEDKKEQKQ